MNDATQWDELISYLDRIRPGFRSRIRPAMPEQMRDFEEVIARPIYPAFRHYLERMGGNDDNLFMDAGYYTVSIEDLIAGAIDTRDEECGPCFFEKYLVFGVADVEVYGVCVSGADHGRVVLIDGCEEDTRHPRRADSLLGFVFGYGFSKEVKRLATQSAHIATDAIQRAAVIDHLSKLFEPESYSDSVRWYGRAPNMLADLSHFARGAKLSIRITADSADSAMKVASRLSSDLRLPDPELRDL